MAFKIATTARERRLFYRHFVEMVLAMLAGMVVLGPIVRLACVLTDHEGVLDHAGATGPIMATNMTVGMVVWMRHRGHGWPATAEMAGAMYAPLAVMAVPYAAGLVGPGPFLGAMHLLMLPFMAAVMLRRAAEYTADHAAHAHQGAAPSAAEQRSTAATAGASPFGAGGGVG